MLACVSEYNSSKLESNEILLGLYLIILCCMECIDLHVQELAVLLDFFATLPITNGYTIVCTCMYMYHTIDCSIVLKFNQLVNFILVLQDKIKSVIPLQVAFLLQKA